jgi:hypothetical protein
MKIRTDVLAGMTFEECDAQRNWWKYQAQLMESYGGNRSMTPPPDLWFPCMGNPPVPGSGSGSTPPPTTLPAGGGYVAGVWVPDKSGTCA